MPAMKPDQERVKNLLTDTVTLLCKNGLQFSKELKVQGLLGITTDDNDVFVVHINETFCEAIDNVSCIVRKDPSQTVEVDKDKSVVPTRTGRRVKRFSADDDGSDRPAKMLAPSSSPAQRQQRLQDTQDSKILAVTEIKTENDSYSLKAPCAAESSFPQFDDSSGTADDRNAMLSSYRAAGSGADKDPAYLVPHGLQTSHSHSQSQSYNPAYQGTSQTQSSGDGSSVDILDDSALSGLETMVMDPVTSWDPLQSGSHEMVLPGLGAFSRPRWPRRPTVSNDKPFKCDHPGCGKAYYEKHHLNHHQYMKHGKQKPLRKPPFQLESGAQQPPHQP